MGRRQKNGLDGPVVVVGLVIIELHFPESHSLKHKRMMVKGLKDRLRGRFNVSVAETGYQDLWQRAALAVASVGSERRVVEGACDAIVREVEKRFPAEILSTSIELLD